jgi:hypothetical protein
VTHERFDQHLEAEEIAAYVDGAAAGDARAAIQAHLAACSECRAEVAEVLPIVRALPRARRVRGRIWIPAAAAAALALLWAGPRALREPAVQEHREEAVTMTVSPRVVAPVGAVDSARVLIWSSVPAADRYRTRLFDSDGTVIWEHETGDTVAALPSSVALRRRLSYFWKVEAHTGFDRWAASDLIEFMVRRGGGP